MKFRQFKAHIQITHTIDLTFKIQQLFLESLHLGVVFLQIISDDQDLLFMDTAVVSDELVEGRLELDHGAV
jgi:hypothetical protein